MSSQADRMPDLPRKPMMRLEQRPGGRIADAARGSDPSPVECPPLSFVPAALPAAWRESPQAPVAVRQARALSDDERLAAAAMYLWLRNRALDTGGEGPLVMLCDPHGWPVADSDGAPRSLDGKRLDGALVTAMNADR
ncbi:MAG TPA: hypothetical protein PKA20_07195 [Burkholderiaceae bacterium]|nr:hypothetical protein [Burkholderiaceae bacterium]